MPTVTIQNQRIRKLFAGNTKIKKGYLGSAKVFSAGNTVTYHVDSGVIYQEEWEYGTSVLSPHTFVPTKAGYSFIGWKQDSSASGNTITSLLMADDPISLYAVFEKAITLTACNGNANPAADTKYAYYNNGNETYPQFTLEQASLSVEGNSAGWIPIGWSVSPDSATVAYSSLSNTTLYSDTTLYGCYQKAVGMWYLCDPLDLRAGETKERSTAYYNSSGTSIGAVFSLKPADTFTKEGYLFKYWRTYLGNNVTAETIFQPGDIHTVTGLEHYLYEIDNACFLRIFTEWEEIAQPYTFMDGSGVFASEGKYYPWIIDNGVKKYIYPSTDENSWREIYSITQSREWCHIDGGDNMAEAELPTDRVIMKAYTANEGRRDEWEFGGMKIDNDCYMEFKVYRVVGNYGTWDFTISNIDRRGCSKAEIFITNMQNATADGLPSINGVEINNNYAVYTVPLDTSSNRTDITFHMQCSNSDSYTTLRIAYIKLIE